MLYFVGMGLKPEHMTIEAVEVLKQSDRIFFDSYTVQTPKSFINDVEKIVNKKITRVERDFLEVSFPFDLANEKKVSILVPGDPFMATTHISILIEAKKRGIKTKYVPGISIMSVAPSLCGLQHYKFCRVVTIPKEWKKMKSYEKKINESAEKGLHTLLLVDTGMDKEEIVNALNSFINREFIVVSQACWSGERVIYGKLKELQEKEWGSPPFTLIMIGNMHPLERESLEMIT